MTTKITGAWVHCAVLAAFILPTNTMLSVAVAADAPSEITVTARRKEESLQKVPLAVTAIGTEAIEKRGIRDLEAVVSLDPSFVVDQGFSAEDTRIAVRGLSNTRGKSSVAFLVDGVDVTSESTLSAGSSLLVNQRLLGDVERIELLKGPQSALYGRSAFAGAISYVTKNANLEEFEGSFALELSEFSRHQVSGSVSGPIIPGELGARFQAVQWGGDSFYDNAASGRNLGGPEGWGTAFTLNYEPSETTELKWRTSYSDSQAGAQPQVVFRGSELEELPIPPQAFEMNGGPLDDDAQVFALRNFGEANGRKVFASENPFTGGETVGSDMQLFRSTLFISGELGPGRLSSTTGFTDADFIISQDVDYQAIGFPDTIPNNFFADSINETQQVSQEFRYATELDGNINYTAGLLGWMENRDALGRSFIATCAFDHPICNSGGGWQEIVRLADLQYGDNDFTFAETKHLSLYGLVDLDVNDRLALSAEVRWVTERFEVDRTTGTPCLLTPFGQPKCTSLEAPGVRVMGTRRSNYLTPKISAEFDLSDTALIYASVGKGQKPAGISTLSSGGTQRLESLEFDSEKIWAYEAGWKTSFDGDFGRVVFNGALFYQDYSDKQVLVNLFDPLLGTIPSVENASSATVFGQELQVVYMPPIDGLSINLGYTHLDSEFDDYVSEVVSATPIAQSGQCEVAISKTGSGETVCIVDLSGKELEASPKHTFRSTVSYEWPLFDTGLEGLVEFDASYTADRFVGADNYSVVDNYWLSNLRLGVSNDQWSAVFFVDNLFDDDTIRSKGARAPDFGVGFSIPPTLVNSSQLPTLRVAGVRLKVDF